MSRESHSTPTAYFMVTLFLSAGFGLFLAGQRVSDPFLYYDLALVKSLSNASQLSIPESGPFASLASVAGRQMLMFQLSQMMGVSVETLQFLPIGAILVSTTLYVVLWRLTRLPLAACLVTLYLTLNLSHAAALYSVFAYALALPLFFGLILLCRRLFEQRGVPEIGFMILLFAVVHEVHYTIAAWMIAFLAGASAMIWLQRKRSGGDRALPSRPVCYLTLSFLVVFLAFNETLYGSYLPLFGREALQGASHNFWSYLALNSPADGHSPYQFTRSTSSGLVSALTLLIILLPLGITAIQDSWRLLVLRDSCRIQDWRLPFVWGILVVGAIDALSYTIRGSISTKSIALLFPIALMLVLSRQRRRTLLCGVAALLLITSMLKIGIFYQNHYVIGETALSTPYERIQPSADWLQLHQMKSRYFMLADLDLYGKYLLAAVDDPQEPLFLSYTETRYEQLIGVSAEAWSLIPDIIAIDSASAAPVIGYIWTRLAPLATYSEEISQNPALNLIYDDGAIWLARPAVE